MGEGSNSVRAPSRNTAGNDDELEETTELGSAETERKRIFLEPVDLVPHTVDHEVAAGDSDQTTALDLGAAAEGANDGPLNEFEAADVLSYRHSNKNAPDAVDCSWYADEEYKTEGIRWKMNADDPRGRRWIKSGQIFNKTTMNTHRRRYSKYDRVKRKVVRIRPTDPNYKPDGDYYLCNTPTWGPSQCNDPSAPKFVQVHELCKLMCNPSCRPKEDSKDAVAAPRNASDHQLGYECDKNCQ